MRAVSLGVVAAGAVVTIVAAGAFDMSAEEGAEMLAVAAAAALAAGLAGGLALRFLRNRSIAVQVAAVSLTAVVAVGAGALAAARAMFISTHDLRVLVVVLGAASTVAVLSGLVLGGRVAAASRAIEASARRLGEGSDPEGFPAVTAIGAPTTPSPAAEAHRGQPGGDELASLARQLEATSTRLDEARRHERALEASRRELVAWVSHDLRTPLAGIRAMVEALEDGVVSEPQTVARYHRTLRLEADRLALLVDDLFELSRIQSGALSLQLERASLSDVVSDALAASAPLAAAKGVRLEGRVSTAPPHLALSTPEVSRALRNLLENAIRHTPSDGAITVDVGVEDDRAVVSVADACGGIPSADLERVFEPAFRGESARTPAGREGGGGGFGLAIVRGIVEAHHGDVAVSNEGVGCRFVVRLPLVTAG